MDLFDTMRPDWMEPKPVPHPEERRFNEKPLWGLAGKTKIDKLIAWVDNPRIDIPVERWKQDNLGREPSNEDLLDIMLDYSVNNQEGEEDDEDDVDTRRNRRNALIELAESIRRNGIRVPLIVTRDRRILDGNRRFLANLYLYRLTDDLDERALYETVPVWVLPEDVNKKLEDRVLTEVNAINDCYKKWPYYIIAKRIFEDYKDGMTVEDLQKKYHNYAKGRIKTVIEAYRVAAEFIERHDDSLEAKDKAYRKLIWFDELRRSNSKAMEQSEFREAIYDLVLDPNSPFSSHVDFRGLEAIYGNTEAWNTLTKSVDTQALEKARFIVNREKFEGKSDLSSKMKRVNELLTGVVDSPGLHSVEASLLSSFHNLAAKIPDPSTDMAARSQRLMDLLDGLTSREIASLPKELSRKLGSVADRVRKQAESSKEN